MTGSFKEIDSLHLASVMLQKHHSEQLDTLTCLFAAYLMTYIDHACTDDYNLQQRLLADVAGYVSTARDERVRITQQLSALDLPLPL